MRETLNPVSSKELPVRPLSELIMLALLLGAGMILQAVEALYLPPLMIPGAKLGLANSVTLITLALFGWKDVLSHVLLRVTAVALVTGTFLSTTYVYSLLGGMISACLMILCRRYLYGPLSFAGVSLVGALAHNLTQLTVAFFVIAHQGVLLFLPWLIFMAVIAGLFNGLLVNMVAPRLAMITAELKGG